MSRQPPSTTALIKLPPLPAAGASQSWGQAYGCAQAPTLVELALNQQAPVLALVAEPRAADRLWDELRFFAPEDLDVVLFPDSETLPYDAFSPHPDITSQRLAALKRLAGMEQGIVVAAVPSLLQRLAPQTWVVGSSLQVEVGDKLDIQRFRKGMAEAGYATVSEVTSHGELAVRGSLLDIFPMGSDRPYRIDLFDDEIDTIRRFDPESQRSDAPQDAVSILPAREFPFTEAAIASFRERFREAFPGDLSQVQIYKDVSDGIAPGGIEYYLPLFFEHTATLFDYLPPGSTVADLDQASAGASETWRNIEDRYEQLRHDLSQPRLPPRLLFIDDEQLASSIASFACIRLQTFAIDGGINLGGGALPPVQLASRAPQPAAALKSFLSTFDGRVLFTAESPGRREMLRQLLTEYSIPLPIFDSWADFAETDTKTGLAIAQLEQGACFPTAGVAIVPEAQLFGERVRRRRRRRHERDPEAIIRELSDLNIGAPVVHEEHGIGRYLGLETLSAGGHTGEFLSLEYAGGDRLYVPVQALDLITRYMGAAAEHAPLHRLGSEQWQKARQKAALQARDVAAELLDVYARRAARSGKAHRYDERDYRAFRDQFPFDETADQAETIEQVLQDLSAPLPMDRVVCGDVGFGKTEVAMRAAFAATQAGRQVAILVPTTLLAQQHFQTFSDRFADWPVHVEVLSRFRSGAETSRILSELEAGKVDIVIGTHKILQNDVKFAYLGLVIIDEEHRFGVRHKERLKKLRAEVDVLTLTATPIPRTLNMAMGGLRDLSLIATPPSERLAVKTFVSQWQDAVIREAFLREIRRGGQIYFLHNRVETIDQTARKLEQLVPEARVRIAHGQMRERDLEQIMLDFYHRRFNVLVCTTIIESGIDVPTANTIVIDRADRLGLAQLHQLRGRVGRSHHRAYAYLLTPPRKAMTADAIKRLEAIESLEDLGAGFMLATHDLEIRGAGELLGEGQSGQIHEVGFAMYTEMLERAVSAIKSGRDPDLSNPLEHGTEIGLGVSALLPADFVPDVHTRLVLYKRISAASDNAALRDLQVEFIDRFGLLPEPAQMLFKLAELRLKASELGIRRLEVGERGGLVHFSSHTQVDPVRLIRLIQEQSRIFRLDGQTKLRFSLDLADVERRFAWSHGLLDDLGAKSAAA
ncbi:MAG: transcription-repair coupling factor [Gammaproteobacteria bacterium]